VETKQQIRRIEMEQHTINQDLFFSWASIGCAMQIILASSLV
jgi:hypothetical protein